MEPHHRDGHVTPARVGSIPELTPAPDPEFSKLLDDACSGAVPVYYAELPPRLITPFDPTCNPAKHPVGEAAVRQVMEAWRNGQIQRVWLYQKGERFILADDYIVWEAIARGKPDYIPCWILGKPNHTDAENVQGPIHSHEVPQLLGIKTVAIGQQPDAQPSPTAAGPSAGTMRRPQYRFSTGLFDWLFGTRATLTLPDGQSRVVTASWLRAMAAANAVKQVPPPEGELISVHMLGKGDDLTDEAIGDIDAFFEANRITYRKGQWRVGKEISAAEASQHWDPATNSVYVFFKMVDEKWTHFFLPRKKFEELRDIERRLQS